MHKLPIPGTVQQFPSPTHEKKRYRVNTEERGSRRDDWSGNMGTWDVREGNIRLQYEKFPIDILKEGRKLPTSLTGMEDNR